MELLRAGAVARREELAGPRCRPQMVRFRLEAVAFLVRLGVFVQPGEGRCSSGFSRVHPNLTEDICPTRTVLLVLNHLATKRS